MNREHLSHWERVGGHWHAVAQFLDWLWENYQVDLDFDRAKPGTPLERRRLLNEFFEVDETGLDAERREILEEWRVTNIAPHR